MIREKSVLIPVNREFSILIPVNRARHPPFPTLFFGISFAEIAMASFKEVQEMLCLGLIEAIIDEEEFVALYAAFRSSKTHIKSLIKLN